MIIYNAVATSSGLYTLCNYIDAQFSRKKIQHFQKVDNSSSVLIKNETKFPPMDLIKTMVFLNCF